MFCASFLRSARTDCRDNDLLILGRSRLPHGFEALQKPPLSFSPYVAARIVHSLIAHASIEPDAELARKLLQYGETRDLSLSVDTAHDCRERLRRLLVRAGVAADSVPGAVLLVVWTRHVEKACELLTPRPVYPALLHAIECEARHARLQERTRSYEK
jgi:hypothetical protein